MNSLADRMNALHSSNHQTKIKTRAREMIRKLKNIQNTAKRNILKRQDVEKNQATLDQTLQAIQILESIILSTPRTPTEWKELEDRLSEANAFKSQMG